MNALHRFVALVGVAILAAACASANPPTATPVQEQGESPAPTTAGDANAAYPATMLGLPVLTVDAASRLLLDGKLDGRVAAVAGYWMEGMPVSCPFAFHQPALSTRCSSVALADRYLHLGSYTESSYSWSASQGPGLLIPLTVRETSLRWDGTLPSQMSAENPNPAQRVVVIGHAGDARLWQCPLDTRPECAQAFVVDRVAWVNGVGQALKVPDSVLELNMTIAQAIEAAGLTAPADVLAAEAVGSGSVGTIDPRLTGVGGTTVWVIRAVSGNAAADGTAAATNVVVDDQTGEVLRTVDLAASGQFTAGRLIVDVTDERPSAGGNAGYASYSVSDANGQSLANSISDPPLVLVPGSYALRGYITGSAAAPPACDGSVQIAAGTDAFMVVTFAADGSCTWTVGGGPG